MRWKIVLEGTDEFDIEKGTLAAGPKSAAALIECLAAARS